MPSSGFKKCARSEEHTSELQSHDNLVCRLLLEKKTVGQSGTRRPQPTESQPHTPQNGGRRVGRREVACRRASAWWSWTFRPALSFFFNDTATTEIYTLSLHDALPI